MPFTQHLKRLCVSAMLLAMAACQPSGDDKASKPVRGDASGVSNALTPESAIAWARDVSKEARGIGHELGQLSWVQANFITEDTSALVALSRQRLQVKQLEWARGAARFDDLDLDYDTARKLRFMKQGFVLPPPADPAANVEMAQLATQIPAQYSSYNYCRADGECLDFEQMNQIMASSRDPQELLEIWTGWRGVSVGYRDDYARLMALANVGARELGFTDTGALWRIGYDMPPEDFAAELDRLIGQMRPLYEALHCHVRAKLNEHYGDEVVPASGPIPAHLTGNMWAQSWGNLFPLMGLRQAEQAFDITQIIEQRGMSEVNMARTAENFFISLGFDPLPQTFWQRSLFTRPQDRDVDCYASAWHIDNDEDVRLKMCVQRTEEDFSTLHHELGHNYYQLAYRHLDFAYHNGANDGFHEAIGDTLALSVGPRYLQQIGFIDEIPERQDDVALLMKSALDKVAILPWAYLVDQWRWRVFSGDIGPEEYNASWWELRERYQGIGPPVARGEQFFDAGAKYHVPSNVPYTRYFLAAVLQFQFHRELCESAGHQGPLNRCSIYGSKAAGEKMRGMLQLGASRPWQEALEVMTGSRQMDATAMLGYYAPLQAWLDEQNAGRSCGW